MSGDFHIVIPARYQSTRLPGKLLMDLNGMTVIERVYRQALKANPASVTIAVDNQELFERVQQFDGKVMMTSVDHLSGTDRIAEVINKGNYSKDDIIVNVQGDEPLIEPQLIIQAASALMTSTASVATLCWPIDDRAACNNPNVVKVVCDKNNHALYFSRSAIPFNRSHPSETKHVYRHIGLYAYRASFLSEWANWPACELEDLEALEQLRILWQGYKIKVEQACAKPRQDINTMADLENARRQLNE